MAFEPVKEFLNPKDFIEKTIAGVRGAIGNQKVYTPVSGGVDSFVVARLLDDALGYRSIREHYTHGGMREGESEEVASTFEKIIPIRLYDAEEYFMNKIMKAGEDSELKRKATSIAYFITMLRRAKSYGCRFVADGTIEPDWIETLKMGLKWQHNIPNDYIKRLYEKTGIQFIHPLFYQAKPQSRAIAEFYDLPAKERRPFPGPGLYIRNVGQVTPESMKITREADAIATPALGEFMEARDNDLDKQYFSAIVESWKRPFLIGGRFDGIEIKNPNIYRAKVTGMHEDKRTYRRLLTIESGSEIQDLIGNANNIVRANSSSNVGRVALNLRSRKYGGYTALLRAIETIDFTEATVPAIPRQKLESIADELLEMIPELNSVAFDFQQKPDSTIEFE